MRSLQWPHSVMVWDSSLFLSDVTLQGHRSHFIVLRRSPLLADSSSEAKALT